MTAIAERIRRVRGRASGRLHSLPILALVVHTACNCRCVMCDIWRANASGRELSDEALSVHVGAIRRLRVRRVMLTGGEPLLHSNLWSLCDRIRAEGISITLVTTGLLAARWAAAIASRIDTVVISLDGPPGVHDLIRRVPHGFDKLAAGVLALQAEPTPPRLIARSVVQRNNYAALGETIHAARRTGFDEISFLAADVSSAAFNRPAPWPETRVAEVAIPAGELPSLSTAIDKAIAQCADELTNGFVVGGVASLRRIYDYYSAIAGLTPYPRVRCNAPWISAVLEPGGVLRPCFFHPAYAGEADRDFEAMLNGAEAVRFRKALDVSTDDTCRRCVCSLHLRPGADV